MQVILSIFSTWKIFLTWTFLTQKVHFHRKMSFTRFLVKVHLVDGLSTLQFESAFDSFYWGFPEGNPPCLTMVGIRQDGLNEYVSQESIILQVKINDRKQSTHPYHAQAGAQRRRHHHCDLSVVEPIPLPSTKVMVNIVILFFKNNYLSH